MSVTVSRTVTIAAPVDAVLATVRDVDAQHTWWPGMVSSEVVERDGHGLPLRARIVSDVKVATDRFEVRYRHTEDALHWELEGSSLAQRAQEGAWVLAPVDGGTEVTLSLTVTSSLPLPRMVQRKVIGDNVAGAVAALARRCEQG